MIQVSLDLQGPLAQLMKKGINLGDLVSNGDLEAIIQNRQKHAVVAEFGSGIYNESGQPAQPITAKDSIFTIPVVEKYATKVGAGIVSEARTNALKYPEILSKLKAGNPGLIGFIFRRTFKGMKPIRMVRGTKDKAEVRLLAEMEKVVEYMLTRSYQRTLTPRILISRAMNTAAAYWLREIVKKSPVLTSNLKTGWTITKLAQ